MMLRVLHLIYDDPRNPWVGGGGSVRAFEIYRRLTDEVEVTVATGNYPGAKEGTIDGVRYVRLGSPGPYAWSRWSYSRAAARLLRRGDYDVAVVDFSVYAPVPIPADLPIGLNVNHLTGPSARARWGSVLGAALERYEARLVRGARRISVISEWTEEMVRRIVPADTPIEPVGCGVADEFFRIRREEEDFVLYFGRMDLFQKGLDVLLQAAARLVPMHPDLRLRMVGRGKDAEVRSLVRKLGLDAHVELRGGATDAERMRLFAGAKLMVMPSRFEGFGLVAGEAMAAGVPLVATSAGALPEVVDPPGGGVVVPPADPDALAAAMAGLLDDPDRRAALTESARRSARRFSWDVVAERHLAFLHHIAEDFGLHERLDHDT